VGAASVDRLLPGVERQVQVEPARMSCVSCCIVCRVVSCVARVVLCAMMRKES
jgi:hypothetical protein